MKRTNKLRAICLFIAFAMTVSLFAGCQNNQTTPVDGELPLYTVKYLTTPMDIATSDETPVGEYIKEKFNIVFEFVPYSGDMKEKQSLMLAGGDYNELQWLQGDDVALNYYNAGALLNIEDYKDVMPEFYERFEEQIPYWKLLGDDGGLYKYETKVPLRYHNNIQAYDIAVRTDALEQQGWPLLVSASSWVEFLKTALELSPTTNGQNTVGMTAPLAESFGLSVISIMYEKGDTYVEVSEDSNVYNIKTGQFEDQFTNPYVKESIKFFNTLYREGLLDEESFTDTADKTQEKMARAIPIAVWYTSWYNTAANSELRKAGNGDLIYYRLPVMSDAQYESGQQRAIKIETTRSYNAQGITKNAVYPERLAELISWACSDEGQIILRSGVEGDTWERDETGKRVPLQKGLDARSDTDLKTKTGMDIFYGILPCFNLTAQDGQYHNLFLTEEVTKQLQTNERLLEYLDAYNWESTNQWFVDNSFFYNTGLEATVTLDQNSDLGKISQKMVDVREQFTPRLIMASSEEEFERIWEQAMAEYDLLDHEAVIDEFNRLLSEQEAKVAKYR